MESIQTTLATMPINRTTPKSANICLYGESKMVINTTNNLPFISRYNDEKATNEQINSLLGVLFATFHHSPEEQIAIVSSVMRNEMSLKRLRDAINYCLDNFKTFKPKPADIVQFDQEDENFPIYSCAEAVKMTNGATHYYYDHSQDIIQVKHPDLYNKLFQVYFENIKNAAGRKILDKQGVPCFKMKDTKNRNFLEQFLTIEPDKVKLNDARIIKY